MTDDVLFDGYDADEEPEPLSAGRRLTLRQKADVDAGRHPLTRGPLADTGSCGSCVHRIPGRYAKCDLGPVSRRASHRRARVVARVRSLRDRRHLMPVTKEQAQRLADLARDIRPHGARRWDSAGILDAIAKVRNLDLAEVSMVVIGAAADRNLHTPAAIGNTTTPLWQGRWRNPDPAIANPAKKTYCSTHGTEINLLGVCKSCAADQLAGDRHPERSNA